MTDTQTADIELYKKCMKEAQLRLSFVKTLPVLKAATGSELFDRELVFLQFRKILECIAFASLIANRDKYSAVKQDFAKFWKAKSLLRDLEEMNPDFYPVPVKQSRVQPDGVKHHELVEEFLTKDDFVSLYDRANEELHVWNPFRMDEPVLLMAFSVVKWSSRIQSLLALHFMRLGDGNIWIVQVPEHGEIGMWLAQPFQFRVEVHDCPEAGYSIHPDLPAAEAHRDSLIKDAHVNPANIVIARVDMEGKAI